MSAYGIRQDQPTLGAADPTVQGGWQLSDLAAGKELHLDARLEANLLEGAGDPMEVGDLDVAGFIEQFSNANYSPVLQTDPEKKPIFKASAVGGGGALLLDEAANFKVTVSTPLVVPYSLFFVTKTHAHRQNNFFNIQSGLTLRALLSDSLANEDIFVTSNNINDIYAYSSAEAIDFFAEWNVWEFHFDTTGYVKINQGETLDFSFTMSTEDLSSFALFSENVGNAAGLGGLVQQVVLISGANFSGDNHDAISARLAHDALIQAKLPDANPYKVTMKAAP